MLYTSRRLPATLMISSLITSIIIVHSWVITSFSPIKFLFIISFIYISTPPKFLLSPRNILFSFYFLWYTFTVYFAPRYQDFRYNTPEEVLAYIMLSCTYIIMYAGMTISENHIKIKDTELYSEDIKNKIPLLDDPKNLFYYTLIGSLFFAFFYIKSSGGIQLWISNPGQAFLKREGAGIYTVLFYYFISLSGFLAGYISFHYRRHREIIIIIIFTLLFIPLLGGKGRIFIHFLITFGCYAIYSRVTVTRIIIPILLLVTVFVLITYLRSGWGGNLIYSSLANYFDTYEALVVSIRDFEPFSKLTIAMPFNKFMTLTGVKEGVFYDMSNWLTSIYFPEIGLLRATVQWPIETDLYLSLGYIWGIPLIFFMAFVIGLIFNKAISGKNLSFIYISINLIAYLMSHLRGGVLYWSDFYFFPLMLISYFLLRQFHIKTRA